MATLAPALVQLRGEVNAVWPDRSKASDGWVADERHMAAGTSDHIPDAAGIVHAIDVTAWQAVGQTLTGRLRTSRDSRIKYVIFRGQMFSSYTSGGIPPWTWRPYSGANGHFHHVHVSVWGDVRGTRTYEWGLLPHVDLKTTREDDVMNPDQERKLDTAIGLGKAILKQLGGDWDAGNWPGWKQLGGRTLIDGVAAVLDQVDGLPDQVRNELLRNTLVDVRDPRTGASDRITLETALTRASEAAEARQLIDGSVKRPATS